MGDKELPVRAMSTESPLAVTGTEHFARVCFGELMLGQLNASLWSTVAPGDPPVPGLLWTCLACLSPVLIWLSTLWLLQITSVCWAL